MIQASQPTPGVDEDPDRIEADRAGVRTAPSLLAKPRGGEAPQARPLARAKARQGMLPGAVARQERAHAARLHLGELAFVSVGSAAARTRSHSSGVMAWRRTICS